MTATTAVQESSVQATGNSAIRPFQKVNVPEAELTELRRRINSDKVAGTGNGHGCIARRAARDDSGARAILGRQNTTGASVEARLNALPQFITEIDGLDIHFIHVRSKHENALPLIVTHGWPGSITEQLKIIDPLTNPTAHGGSASDAFDVVIPSMPGYGFSGKPTTTGWDPAHIARAWVVLMKRLGYTKFVAQGGDWGAIITEQMGVQAPPELLGIHTNMPGAVPAEIDKAAFTGAPMPAGLSPEEKLAFERLQFVYSKGVAYGYQMGLRPQTLYGIADSPVGLAAYFLDHDAWSYALISRVFAGRIRRPHARRHPRQHHDRLVDEHGDFRGPPLLGKQTRVFQCQRRLHPGCRKRLSGRDRSVPAQLGGAGVSQTDPLQQARQGRALCGLGTAEALFRRGSRGLPVPAIQDGELGSLI